jgi:hypothetical protein
MTTTETPRKPGDPIEITLPSGGFARIRPSRLFDTLIATVVSKDPEVVQAIETEFEASLPQADLWLAALLSRVVTIDEKKLTIQDVLSLDARDSSAICAKTGPMLTGPVR